MRVLVCGSRYLTDAEHRSYLKAELAKFTDPESLTLIHGHAPGADTIAESVAEELGWAHIKRFPADWMNYGKSAGPIRNERMLKIGKPDLVLAFHSDPHLGRGTLDMVRRAEKHEIKVTVHLVPEPVRRPHPAVEAMFRGVSKPGEK